MERVIEELEEVEVVEDLVVDLLATVVVVVDVVVVVVTVLRPANLVNFALVSFTWVVIARNGMVCKTSVLGGNARDHQLV